MIESSGILAFRRKEGELEFFLVHPGGPFFVKKDAGYWTVPKGLVEEGEDLLAAARREFREETGIEVSGDFFPLGYIDQKGGKRVHCFGVEFDLDPARMLSNTFEIQWPPNSGKKQAFAEIDRGGWFNLTAASVKINERQVELLGRVSQRIC